MSKKERKKERKKENQLAWSTGVENTFFVLKSGQDSENRAAHPHQEFLGVPPWDKKKFARRGYGLLVTFS